MKGSAQPNKDSVCGWCGRGTQHRNSGSYFFRSFPEAIPPSFSLQDSNQLQDAFSMLVPRLWWDFVSCPFHRATRFLKDSDLTLVDRILADFHNQMLCGCHFSSGDSTLGNPTWVWDPILLKGNLCNWDIFPDSQPPHIGMGPSFFRCPALPPVSMWLLP